MIPRGPICGFGRETTLADYAARIRWEIWAAATERELNHEAHAQGHDLARVAYQEMMARKFPDHGDGQ